MPTQTLIKQFSVGRANDTGWQTLVENLNDWLALGTTNIIFLDAHLETHYSTRSGTDNLTLYVMYLESDAGVRVDYQAAYVPVAAGISFDEWFADTTDANAATQQPIWIGAADPLPTADTQFGRQFFYIYLDKTTNPSGLGTAQAVFVAVPTANIAAGASGTADLYNSEGTKIGTFAIRNISSASVWTNTQSGYVAVDTAAYGITPEFIGLPTCCATAL